MKVMENNTTQPVLLRIEPNLYKAIKNQAKKRNMSATYLMNEILSQYIRRNIDNDNDR